MLPKYQNLAVINHSHKIVIWDVVAEQIKMKMNLRCRVTTRGRHGGSTATTRRYNIKRTQRYSRVESAWRLECSGDLDLRLSTTTVAITYKSFPSKYSIRYYLFTKICMLDLLQPLFSTFQFETSLLMFTYWRLQSLAIANSNGQNS